MSMMGTESIKKTQTLRLALIGFSGPALASLELFVGKDRRLSLLSPDKSDLLVVNGDQGRDPSELQAEYAKKYGKPGVLISVRDLDWPGFVLLKKPYDTSDLFAALEAASLLQPEAPASGLSHGSAHEATIAAVAELGGEQSDVRQQAFAQYREKMGGGHALRSELDVKRQQHEEHRQQMRARLQRGKEAGQRLIAEAEAELRAAEEARLVAEREAEALRQAEQERARKQEEAQLRLALEAEAKRRREAEEARLAAEREAEQRRQAELEKARKQAEEQARIKKAEAARKKAAAEAKADAERKLKAEQAAKAAQQEAERKASQKVAQTPPKVAPAAVQPTLKLTDVAGSKQHVATSDTASPQVAPKQPAPNKTLLNDDEMVYRCCGNLPDVDISRPDERRRIYFSADGALLYWLPLAMKKARMSGTPVEIAGLPRLFAFLPKSEQFYGDFGEELLLQYALSRFGFGELDLRERPDLDVKMPDASGDKQTMDAADAMLWKVALWTARGRLTQGIDPEKVYKLKKRPDFDMMVEIPHAREISELWHERRLSAMDIVRILNIHQRYIFAYMSAVNALGWLQE